MLYLYEPSEIELLGYAKNEILEAMQIITCLPKELREKLHLAYILIDDVQEYLFEH